MEFRKDLFTESIDLAAQYSGGVPIPGGPCMDMALRDMV